MIPRTLLAALGGRELPSWLRDAAGLHDGATVESLEPELRGSGLEPLGRRIDLYFFRLLDSNRAAARRVRVLDRPWPPALDPASVPWPAQAQPLREAGYAADASTLSRVTYGELFAVPRAGTRAVVAFAAAAEAALDREYAGSDVPRELAALERLVAGAEWAARVDSTDPRFAGVLPPGAGALSRCAIWRLPEVCERIESIERTPLDVALRDYVAALGDVDGERLEALLGRLGLDGGPPRTLPEAVNGFGITPERIRQLQVRTLERRPAHRVYMPALDRALAQLAELAPCTAEDAAAALFTSGVSSIVFHPASVLAAAELCRAAAGFVLHHAQRGELVLERSTSARAWALVRLARQRARRFGAAGVTALAPDLPAGDTRTLVTALAGAHFLDDEWFWLPHLGRPRPVALTFRMLAVCSPLDLSVARAGICRAYRRRHAGLVPSESVLAAFYREHPSFEVDARGRVRAAETVDCSAFLGKNDRLFVEVFSRPRSGVLDVAAFRDACAARGMTTHTFAFCKTYSAVLDNPTGDLWCLRGHAAAS